jgi:helix-turn-helix protein
MGHFQILREISALLVEGACLTAQSCWEGTQHLARWEDRLREWNGSSPELNVDFYHFIESAGLNFSSKEGGKRLWITVDFLSAADRLRATKTAEQKKFDKAFRKPLRARRLPEDLGLGAGIEWRSLRRGAETEEEVVIRPGQKNVLWEIKRLVLDSATLERVVLEQLVIYFTQAGLADESVWEYRRRIHPNESLVDELIEKFVDPSWPSSYLNFKKRLKKKYQRERAESSHLTFGEEDLGRIEATNEQERRGLRNLGHSDQALEGDFTATSPQSHSLSVFQASRDLGIPRQTLYRLIKSGRLHSSKREGRLVIDRPSLEKTAVKYIWREILRLRTELTNPAAASAAAVAAARKWVQRKKKAGVKPRQLLLDLQSTLEDVRMADIQEEG